jgi:hypothetical protein
MEFAVAATLGDGYEFWIAAKNCQTEYNDVLISDQ